MDSQVNQSDSNQESSDDEQKKEDDEEEEIDVDFEFCQPAEIDFHGLKTLLKQTFQNDIEKLNDSDLADYIINLNVGTVVKVDDGLDPYAFVSLLDCKKNIPCIKQVKDFILEKSKDLEKLSTILKTKHCGIVLNERLINMPPQIIPNLFKMLLDEIQETIKAKKDTNYDYYIFISKVYTEVESIIDNDEKEEEETVNPKKKKQKVKTPEVFYFQAEDEFIQPHAEFTFDYQLPKGQVSDSRRAFYEVGVEPFRRIMVVPSKNMTKIMPILNELLV
ncbi:p21-C-terminal region-binding protein-domain-containing protein [Globomyces pollinis-pini]|nr:p21-C-terminal region-binding protein-domain-containing protein [Globomyces pollinis-pini]